MKALVSLSVIFLLLASGIKAQNLCVNGDFDTYTSLPNNYAQVCFATGWNSPSGVCALVVGTGSPDYYNVNGSGGCKPPATWWATVMPHSGTGMEGFAAWYPGNYREYIAHALSSPLVVGQTYTVTFWYTNAVSTIHGYGCNKVGVAFSSVPLAQSAGTPIAYVPQLETTAILYSTTWQKLTFSYTPTVAYQYMTIGNFRDNANTSATLFGTGTSGAYYYIDDVSVTLGAPLPVELLSFSGKREGDVNVLSWTTATELNNDHFTVERQNENGDFISLGDVKGAGTTDQRQDYSFTDDFPNSGISYYRLRQTDFDGKNVLSDIIAIKDKRPGTVFHAYSVENHQITLSSFDLPALSYSISLFDIQEKVVYETSLSGGETIVIPTAGLCSGVYALHIENAEFVETRKVVIPN